MKVVYAREYPKTILQPSIFLAGPSPRKLTDRNWRPDALDILRMEFKGTVFVPLPRNGHWLPDYDGQIEWELEYLNKATIIAFWIPRNLRTLPAFTTNVEFGMYVKSGKIILGSPPKTPKMRYLEYLAEKNNVPIEHTLKATMEKASLLAALFQYVSPAV